ncbi:hypothetical protein DXA63_09495 [Segatella copri]|uniref:Uncharacterized protein n=1 Tax=Segatella copri TaxID=165179 RepID=A0AA93BIX5_9BACT|nr:hypothetical protein DXA63_09495 [Segatella copri]
MLAVNINCLFIFGEASSRGVSSAILSPVSDGKDIAFFRDKKMFFSKKLANVPANVPNFCKRFKYFQAITGNHFLVITGNHEV